MEYHYSPEAITAIDGVADDRQRTACRIYTLGGQLVGTANGTTAESVSNLPAGIYVIKNNNTTTKIVKK